MDASHKKTRTELLAEIEAMHDETMLTPRQVAPILGTDPSTLRWQAKNRPESLGFEVTVMKSRVKIPRLAFLRHVRGA